MTLRIHSIRSWFRSAFSQRPEFVQARWQPLGNMEGMIYFIDAFDGGIYCLHRDRIQETVQVQLVCKINRW